MCHVAGKARWLLTENTSELCTQNTGTTRVLVAQLMKVGVTKLSMTRWTNSVLIFPYSYLGMSRRPVNLLSLLPQLLRPGAECMEACRRQRAPGLIRSQDGSWERKACLCPAALSVLGDEVDQKIFGSFPTH